LRAAHIPCTATAGFAMDRARLCKLPYTEGADSYTTLPMTLPLWEYFILLLKGNSKICSLHAALPRAVLCLSSVFHFRIIPLHSKRFSQQLPHAPWANHPGRSKSWNNQSGYK